MTNEKLIMIFARSFYISFNNAGSNIRELIENSIDEKTNTINLSKMVENRTLLKNANPLLYNFLSNTEVIQNAERLTELFKKSEDCIYGYPQIYLEEYVDNKFIEGFNAKVNSTYLKRDQKNSNPVTKKREKFNLVKDFLCSNNSWGKVDFSNISSRENLDSTNFNSPYRFYAKAVYSKIAIGYEKIKEQKNKQIEDKVKKDWGLKEDTHINKQVQVNPYYALDYGTAVLIYALLEKYWNVYLEAEKEYPKAAQKDKQLPAHLSCVLANAELALETIMYVLQKDADCSYEPHLYSEIEDYLKSEWHHEPKVRNIYDLNNYETWGTVLPIDNNEARALRYALYNLNDDLRKKYDIIKDRKYRVSEMVEKLKSIYTNERKQDFNDYERIRNIISEFEGKLETSGGRNSLDREINEDGDTQNDFISSSDNFYGNNLENEFDYNFKNDSDKILSKFIHSFKVTISKINILFMFDFGYSFSLIKYMEKFAKDYFVNRVSSRLCLSEDSENSNNRRNNENKVFNFWKRILKSIFSPIYDVNPSLLINCFDKNSNDRINKHENFKRDIYPQVKEINLNVIEKNILRGGGLNKTVYTGIVNNWFESIKRYIQRIVRNNENKNNDVFKHVFDSVCAEFRTSTKYVDSIKAINLYELNKIIPIKNPFVELIKNKNELLDFETIVIEIEKSVCEGMLEEQTFYNVAFELLKTGNREEQAGDIWSNAYTQYKRSGGKLYNEEEFGKVMSLIIDLGKTITRRPIKGEKIYSKLEGLISTEAKSRFMQDLRMLLSGVEIIYNSDTEHSELKDFYNNLLEFMKSLGYGFVIKYDNKFKNDDYEYKSYDYETSLEEIINE